LNDDNDAAAVGVAATAAAAADDDDDGKLKPRLSVHMPWLLRRNHCRSMVSGLPTEGPRWLMDESGCCSKDPVNEFRHPQIYSL
jgi:hypothetical protein